MSTLQMVDAGWGSFFKFKILTDTRPFAQVDAALAASNIQSFHGSALIERPKPSTAFARAMGYLTRVCTSSIPFPLGSPNSTWEESDASGNKVARVGERNPCFSLKIEPIREITSDGSVAYRINISDRRLKDGDAPHVLTAIFHPTMPIEVKPGTDANAWNQFGQDLTKLVNDSYLKFFNNYDDNDIRDVVDRELDKLKAVRVMGNTTNFISKDTNECPNNTERAISLMNFIKGCDHLAGVLGLNGSEMTRDQIVDELKTSLLSDFDEYEKELDKKLNAKTKTRQRGAGRRAQMHDTAELTIDRMMALAEYHSVVLGVMADGIRERAQQLRDKAREFLTRDFGNGAGVIVPPAPPTTEIGKKIAELEAESLKVETSLPIVNMVDVDDPFSGLLTV